MLIATTYCCCLPSTPNVNSHTMVTMLIDIPYKCTKMDMTNFFSSTLYTYICEFKSL